MERIYREQLNVQDVEFIPVVEQMGITYRENFAGCEVADVKEITDPMVGLLVSDMIPEGYYAEAAEVSTDEPTDEPETEGEETETEI